MKFLALIFSMQLISPYAYSQEGGEVGGEGYVMPNTAEEDYVVATVNGVNILYSQIKAVYESSPQLKVMPFDSIFDKLLEDAIYVEILSSDAKKDGVDKEAKYVAEKEQTDKKLLAVYYLKKQITADMTDDKLQKLYKKFLKENPPQEEVRARHILVDNEAKAKAIITKLNNGADFAALADEESSDSGAGDGGDLGYFTKDTMVSEFADIAFKLKKGEYTKTPVQTQFGWHVILVVDRRKQNPLAFEQVEELLKSQYASQESEEIFSKIKKKAKIKRYGLDGKIPVSK